MSRHRLINFEHSANGSTNPPQTLLIEKLNRELQNPYLYNNLPYLLCIKHQKQSSLPLDNEGNDPLSTMALRKIHGYNPLGLKIEPERNHQAC